MSIECGWCEHDLRGGHDVACPRHPDNADPYARGIAALSRIVAWQGRRLLGGREVIDLGYDALALREALDALRGEDAP